MHRDIMCRQLTQIHNVDIDKATLAELYKVEFCQAERKAAVAFSVSPVTALHKCGKEKATIKNNCRGDCVYINVKYSIFLKFS